jgi:hypothetical protein
MTPEQVVEISEEVFAIVEVGALAFVLILVIIVLFFSGRYKNEEEE